MATVRPLLNQLNLVVADMDATVGFYRRLGLTIEAEPGAEHVNVLLENGFRLEFDTTQFAPMWDSGWRSPGDSSRGGVVLGFQVPTREAVDALYAEIGGGHQPPYDGFWGARYAIVEDPDGNHVGLMSPIDPARKRWPPEPPPSGPPR